QICRQLEEVHVVLLCEHSIANIRSAQLQFPALRVDREKFAVQPALSMVGVPLAGWQVVGGAGQDWADVDAIHRPISIPPLIRLDPSSAQNGRQNIDVAHVGANLPAALPARGPAYTGGYANSPFET